MKRVAILQSNYIPWKGYFDIIHDVDLFIFYDDVQYTTRDWRNRNSIKTQHGNKWVTVPVCGGQSNLIYEVGITETRWVTQHWNSMKHAYGKAPFFRQYATFFEEIYLSHSFRTLSELNQYIIKRISHELLGVKTVFKDSRKYQANGHKTDRLIDILEKSEASVYISGPSAQSYIEDEKFTKAGIQLIYKDYSGYPEYPQLYGEFNHYVSIVDLIFNVGPDAPWYIWGYRDVKQKRIAW